MPREDSKRTQQTKKYPVLMFPWYKNKQQYHGWFCNLVNNIRYQWRRLVRRLTRPKYVTKAGGFEVRRKE